MSGAWSCPRGHQWLPEGAMQTPAAGQACPVCGESITLPAAALPQVQPDETLALAVAMRDRSAAALPSIPGYEVYPPLAATMHVLLYEYTTGGGLPGSPDARESQLLLREGAAMIGAVAADFAAGGNHRVQVLRDARLKDLRFPGCEVLDVRGPGEDEALLTQFAGQADWTLVIAPETGGVLADRCRHVLEAGGRLLGPSIEFIHLAADKHLAAQRLAERGVAVPRGCAIECGRALPLDFSFPAVLKPRDGCGSQGVQLIATRGNAASAGRVPSPSRLEEYRHGLPLSVSFLCGPDLEQALPPCRQKLSEDGRFAYLGGSLPVSADLAARAQALAKRALAALPAACGYIGIDLVLGESSDGVQDCVIEINPRLTTSYVGLRVACRENLAEAMLQAAHGERPSLTFSRSAMQFSASGVVQRISD